MSAPHGRPRRAVPALVAVLLCAAGLVAGCGVPSHTGVSVVGQGAERDGQGRDTGEASPPEPGAATNDAELVSFYLQAAAGDLATAPARLRRFMQITSSAAGWQPGTDLIVVRLDEPVSTQDAAGTTVAVTMHPVGRLSDRGLVEPLDLARSKEIRHAFRVVPGDPGARDRFITNPPDGMYLDSRALSKWYLPHPIYFWDTAERTLVPDLRYLPRSIPQPARPSEVLRWLLAGPSEWLRPAVHPLPPGIQMPDKAVVSNGRLMVNLSAKASELSTNRLLTQLRWSMRVIHAGPLALQIEGQTRGRDEGEGYQNANRAAVSPGDPAWFCVGDGVVLPRCNRGLPTPPVLTATINQGVRSAAITRDGLRAALVRDTGDGRRRLSLSHLPDHGAPVATTTDLGGRTLSRPTWLAGTDRGLIAAEGKLYRFTSGQPAVAEVDTQDIGGITAVAGSPDGRRLAMVAAGRVFVAPVIIGETTLTLGQIREIPTDLRTVAGVAWSQQDKLVLAGPTATRVVIAEVTVDGALEEHFEVKLGSLTVTTIVALPTSPAQNRLTPGSIMIDSTGGVFEIFLRSQRVVTVEGTSPVAPSNGAPAPSATAPFFVD